MGRRLKLNSKEDKFIYFSIIMFVIYIIVSLISEFTLGRKLKALLGYSFLLLSILTSLGVLIYLISNGKKKYYKLIISSLPILYIIVLIILSIK